MKTPKPQTFKRGDVARAWGGEEGRVLKVSHENGVQKVVIEVEAGTITGAAKFFTLTYREQNFAGAI